MSFMKTFWAALLAVIVAGIIMTLVGFMFIASLASFMGDNIPQVKSNSVLRIDLANGVVDAPYTSPFDISLTGGLTFKKANTLLEVISAIEKAAADPNIKGIFIDFSSPGGGITLANMEEIRDAIEQFKESGKFVVAYSDSYAQFGYYLASVADAVFVNPEGSVDWRGMSLSVMFYKGLIDKLGIDVDILRHGTFKSAVEPFMLTSMSPENRLQYTALASGIWSAVLEDVSRSRGIDTELLSRYATDLAVSSAREAEKLGLVDGVAYRDQVQWFISRLADGEPVTGSMATLRTMTLAEAAAEDRKQEYISLPDYITAGVSFGKKTSKNKIAVIYADGTIVDGGDPEEDVVGGDVAARLARARKDDKTKVVVLRVNSPGGSALASEVIWREMELTRQVKPVIVSMGGMAASGGYYIACPADLIVADRMTLTGSIGVFGMMVDVSGALRDKLGVTVDGVRTNPSADMMSIYRKLSTGEREFVMKEIENVYTTFVGHVADGRNMTFDEVDAIGEGRVWSGVDALDIGLIDGYGGLKDAIAIAADRAGIADDFRVWQVVDQADSFSALLSQLVSVRSGSSLKDELGELFLEYKTIKEMVNGTGVKAMLPYSIVIE